MSKDRERQPQKPERKAIEKTHAGQEERRKASQDKTPKPIKTTDKPPPRKNDSNE
jgi:hypothetical protein